MRYFTPGRDRAGGLPAKLPSNSASWMKSVASTVNLAELYPRSQGPAFAFINTGFPRPQTGDEIHTSMEAGSMVPRAR